LRRCGGGGGRGGILLITDILKSSVYGAVMRRSNLHCIVFHSNYTITNVVISFLGNFAKLPHSSRILLLQEESNFLPCLI
jgi:hypothetical protein